MFPRSYILTLLLVAISARVASAAPTLPTAPKSALPIKARFLNQNGTITNIVERDRARAAHILESHKSRRSSEESESARAVQRRAPSFDVTNNAVTYIANVGVGTPPTFYDLIVDTGSSNTWVGATKKYVKTSTSRLTALVVSVTYGSGSFSGQEYTDTVTLSPDLVIKKQSIGAADTSTGFIGVDGILGLGPVDLTEGTVFISLDPLSPAPTVPTVSDNLFSQGTISTEDVGVFFAPTVTGSETNGELTFGGVDSSKLTSGVSYVPITTTSPASSYWGIDQSLSYKGNTILASTAGIVDTGTTLVLIATDAFTKYQTATGGVADSGTGLLKITPAQYAALEPLNFNIGGNTYELTPNAQIFPRSLNTQIGGTANAIYLIVADTGSNSGQGLDFINGYTFLQRFYSVFDTTNQQVGFATTAYTDATTN